MSNKLAELRREIEGIRDDLNLLLAEAIIMGDVEVANEAEAGLAECKVCDGRVAALITSYMSLPAKGNA